MTMMIGFMARVCFLLLSIELVLSVGASVYGYSSTADVLRGSDERVRGVNRRRDVDFVLGGLFPVHTSSLDGNSRCGVIRSERGLERMEAMLYALDLINNNATLLPNVTLGYDIRDTCNSESVGLDESIEFEVGESAACTSHQVPNQNSTMNILPITAVIGASASAVTVPVATLMRLFTKPQVSYASSSPILRNREKYSYFFRTVVSDEQQARAMVDLVLHYKWMRVSTIYANDFYGNPGIAEFRSLADAKGVCVDVDERLNAGFNSADYRVVAQKLLRSSANVVILFASQDMALKLFTALNETQHDRRFLWIASDAWARSSSVVSQFNEFLTGLFGFVPLTKHDPDFDDYFSLLTLDNNKRDPWFPDFFEIVFNCQVNVTCNHSQPVTEHQGYKQGNFIPLVIDSLYSVAHALNDFLNDNCDQPVTWYRDNQTCAGQRKNFDGSTLRDYLQNVSFTSPTGNVVEFDSNGNIRGSYEILNYQQIIDETGGVRHEFVSVGEWSASGLSLSSRHLQFGLNEDGPVLSPVESHCTFCGPGKVRREVDTACCWICDNCLGGNFSNGTSNLVCLQCEEFTWGNNPFTGSNSCVVLEESYLKYDQPFSIALTVMSISGILLVLAVVIVMSIFWSTPIMKSSGREHMIMLLVGITISFLLTSVFITKPSDGVCVLRIYGHWLTFSFILGSLLVKLIQILRIFLREEVTQLKCTGPGWQIFFVVLILAGESVLVIISICVTPFFVERTQVKSSLDFPTVYLSCQSPHVAIFSIIVIYDSLIIVACNVLAVMAVKFPRNYNEARYIASATLALGLIWISFIPTYITTVYEYRDGATSFALNLSAFVILVCFFGPKMFVMVFLPSRNIPEINVKMRMTKQPVQQEGTMKKTTSQFLGKINHFCLL